MALTGADILDIEARPMDSVIVPDWNGAEIYVRKMSAVERAAYEVKMMELNDAPLGDRIWKIKVLCVVLCACNEDGERLFADDQFEAVAAKSTDAVDLVFTLADKLNLITQHGVETEAGN
jgi:hypothetical protein